jgi:hypothetical protein
MTTITQTASRRQPAPRSGRLSFATSTHSGLGQWLLGSAALGISLAVGTISLTINFKFGLQASLLAACIFAVADIAKLSLPFMGEMFGWNFGFGRKYNFTAYGVCLVTSITCAGFHLIQDRAQERIDIERQESTFAGASADQGRARTALAELENKEASTVEALDAQLASAKTLAAEAEKAAKEAGITCAQRTKCVAATAVRDKLVERLGLAKRRDQLKAELNTAKGEASTAAPKALGPADDIVALTGASKTAAAIGVSLFLTLLQLFVLEVLAPLSGVAAMIFGNAIERRKAAKAAASPVKAAKSAPAPVEPRTLKEKALLKLQLMCWNAPGGVLITSRSALFQAFQADGLAVKRTAFYEWCKEWQSAGEIEVKDNGKRASEIRARLKAA